MKCEKARTWLFLEQSGELSRLRSRRLTAHLAACAECARYRDELSHITGIAKTHLPTEGPAENVILKIIESTPVHGIRHVVNFPWIAARIVAWAAVAVAIVGGTMLFMPLRTEKYAGPEHTLSAIMAIVDDEPPEKYHSPDAKSRQEIERELGRHLLRIEGLLDDDLLAAVML